jgi:ribosomal protein S12 methylthiotransferase
MPTAASSYFLATLGCPKNAVDSEKMAASLEADGLSPVDDPGAADLIVVNTCAFVHAAREESVETALALADARREGARLVVTGCMAERYGEELAAALPEADAVVGFAGEASIAAPRRKPIGVNDLLDLPRRRPERPWAYLKVAEGCDRACAFCAIPKFRGTQVSRAPEAIEAEARSLVEAGVAEIVLVAQDTAWYGRDAGRPGSLPPLLHALDRLAGDGLARLRLLYLYPSEVKGALVDAMCELPTAVPYFDLSLQHASAPLLRGMKRWGNGERFLDVIGGIRARRPEAAFRSSFIVGFPGETEDDHDQLLAFLEEARLDWAGFFPFSREDDTAAASMDGAPPADLVAERISELSEVQDRITAAARHALVGAEVDVLVDEVDGDVVVGRTFREAPEIDGIVRVSAAWARAAPQSGGTWARAAPQSGGTWARAAPQSGGIWARPGAQVRAKVVSVTGPDLEATALGAAVSTGTG